MGFMSKQMGTWSVGLPFWSENGLRPAVISSSAPFQVVGLSPQPSSAVACFHVVMAFKLWLHTSLASSTIMYCRLYIINPSVPYMGEEGGGSYGYSVLGQLGSEVKCAGLPYKV